MENELTDLLKSAGVAQVRAAELVARISISLIVAAQDREAELRTLKREQYVVDWLRAKYDRAGRIKRTDPPGSMLCANSAGPSVLPQQPRHRTDAGRVAAIRPKDWDAMSAAARATALEGLATDLGERQRSLELRLRRERAKPKSIEARASKRSKY